MADRELELSSVECRFLQESCHPLHILVALPGAYVSELACLPELPRLENQTGPVIKGRYASFKSLFNEVIKWRDAAVHRITPFVITHSPGEPDKVPREKMEIKMVAQSDADISLVVKGARTIQWVEPLHYHKKWLSQLIEFCKEVCLDIRSQTLQGT